jgi:hypothetical protein
MPMKSTLNAQGLIIVLLIANMLIITDIDPKKYRSTAIIIAVAWFALRILQAMGIVPDW